LDAEIERLDNLEDTDIEVIRKKRLEAMKNAQLQKAEWQKNGNF
jgi:hypothetical protein